MEGGIQGNRNPAFKAPSGRAAWLLLHLDPAVLLHQPVLPDPIEPSRTAQLLMTFALCNVFLPSRTYITSCHQELGLKTTFSHVSFPHLPGQ